MQERIIFREMLSEIKALADTKGNRLTVEEIRDFFSDAGLNEEQLSLVYAYLAEQKIEVEGYEAKPEKGVSQEQEAGGMTEDAYMQMYLEDLNSIPTVTEEEEEKLFLLAAAGDDASKNRLVEIYLRMVCDVAHTYSYGGVSQNDLIQEGNVALMLAIHDLEIMEGLEEYRTYVYDAVRKAMEEALTEQQDFRDLDEKIAERVNHLNESVKNLEQELEHKVSIGALSAYLEMPVEEIRDILRMAGDKIEIEG